MRLGQLARKVKVKPAQITSFLEKEHNIIIENNLNTKIEDVDLKLVLENFKIEPIEVVEKVKVEDNVELPPIEEMVIEEVVVEEEENIGAIIIESIKPKEIKTKEPEEIKVIETEKLTVIDEDGEEIELTVVDGIIKAPKKELEGFKVIGKINLPEKKRSISFIITTAGETTDITEDIFEKKGAVAKRKKELYIERKKTRQEKSKKRKGAQRKVLSELELKERANKLAVEKQIKKTKVNKALKKKRYEEKIQKNSITEKSLQKKKEKKLLKTIKTVEKEPTTTWGKIVKWFNT